MNLEQVKDEFKKVYHREAESIFHAPGRINLIGEHTDYNGGYVFPCALNFGIHAAVSMRDDDIVRLASTNFNLRVETSLLDITYKKGDDWANYPKGVISELLKAEKSLGGLDILYSGNIPNGAGLSTSAAIEVLTAVLFNDLFALGINMLELALLSQRAENNFIGLMCGIMDQFAVSMGKKGHAILLDCKTLAYEHVPILLEDARLVIANTNIRRELSDSKYNERRAECNTALNNLNKELQLKCLCDLSNEEFEHSKHLIQDTLHRKRAMHVVYENSRTKAAVAALKNNDIIRFGQMMNESHKSLKELYEVTGIELDTLAEAAQSFDGCLGARMTGAGFGGCTVSIVQSDRINEFITEIGNIYKSVTGIRANFYVADIGNGAARLSHTY